MCVNIQSIKDIRSYLTRELNYLYPEGEINALANITIKTVIGVTKLHGLYLTEHPVTKLQSERVVEICHELKNGKPIQYILGETTFYGCKILVTRATLIPRSETEELVELIIRENRGFKGTILDIGTGSGCIAIALAKNLPGSIITGLDISEEAIMIAKKNATLNNADLNLIQADLFNINPGILTKADIIVSNPPYVRNLEKQFMNINVLDFEPHIALFVDDDEPLEFYKVIVKLTNKIMAQGGMLYFEINEAMGKSIVELLEKSKFTEIEIFKDINGKDRIVKGKKYA